MMGTELTLKRKKEVGWRLVGRADGKYEKMEKKSQPLHWYYRTLTQTPMQYVVYSPFIVLIVLLGM